MLYGIDVSHWQSPRSPGGLTWTNLAANGCAFAMVRATYGTAVDDRTLLHVDGARLAGIKVGLYHFFRMNQPVDQQVGAFLAQAKLCGFGRGDIAPAVDIEEDGPKGAPVSVAWSAPAAQFTQRLVELFGESLVYITQRCYGMMGKPQWVRERPLWVAHYTGATSPATPENLPWVIWQHRVGPYVLNGAGGAYAPDGSKASGTVAPGPLDQNRAIDLPRCALSPWAEPDFGHADLVKARLDADTAAALASMDTDHSDETMQAYEDEPTKPG